MNIAEYLTNPLIFQYKEILSEEIPFSKAVVDMCRANQCGKYGTCWTCPPGAGEPEEIEAKIKAYKSAVVFTCKYELEDCFDFEGMTAGQHKTRKVLEEIIQNLKKDNISFLALGCEGCNLCKKCTYPDSPCRFPNKAIVSVEACGINVVELARNIGINYNNGPQTVTYFCIILF